MRITDVLAYSLRLPESISSLSGSPADAAHRAGGECFTVPNSPNLFSRCLEAALVRIETDDGLVGWGEAQAPVGAEVVATAIDRLLRPQLLGSDAGFDSLALVMALAELEDRFHIELPVEKVEAMQDLTFGKLAALIREQLGLRSRPDTSA